MRAGRLRRKATIQQRTDTRDANGASEPVWSTFLADVPFELRALTGGERIAAASMQSPVVAKGVMRYAAGVLPAMRLVTDDAETYVILSVLPDPTGRRSLTLDLEKGPRDA